MLAFGDSILLGTGDARGVGWPGRLAGTRLGPSPVIYNLGVASDTVADISARWHGEAAARSSGAGSLAIVFAFGINDATLEQGRHRVPLARCLGLGRSMIERAAGIATVLWIGPTLVDETHQPRRVATGQLRDKRNREIARYDAAFAELAGELGRPYLSLFPILAAEAAWCRELADGVHPDTAGHDRLAALIGAWPPWRETVGG
mgnify:CR=1 FL=1